MKYPLARTVLAFTGVLLLSTADLPAQQRGRPPSLDVGAGLSVGGGGGVRHHRGGTALSGVLALGPREQETLVLALSGVLQGPIGSVDLSCLMTPQGTCAPNYPWMQSLGALGGVQASRGARGSAVRLLAGPAVYRTAEGSAAGMEARLDLATRTLGHVAGIVWAHGGIIPRLNGEGFRMGAMGLGFRVR